MKRVDPILRKARIAWNSQIQRCTNPKVKSYQHYGGKGICVEYTADEFAAWYVVKYKSRQWSRPSVGRIDHDKNYSLNNVEMIEHADNAREMYERTGGNAQVECRPVVLVGPCVTHAFSTTKAASEFAGVTASYICLRKRIKANPGKKTRFPFQVFDLDDFFIKEFGLSSTQPSNSTDTRKLVSA